MRLPSSQEDGEDNDRSEIGASQSKKQMQRTVETVASSSGFKLTAPFFSSLDLSCVTIRGLWKDDGRRKTRVYANLAPRRPKI